MRQAMCETVRTGERKRRGAAAIEFAVVAPVLFLFIFGIIELGRGLMLMHLMTNAARAGCRVGAIPGKSNADVTAAVTNSLNGQGISTESVTIQVNDGSGN